MDGHCWGPHEANSRLAWPSRMLAGNKRQKVSPYLLATQMGNIHPDSRLCSQGPKAGTM